MKKSVCVDLDGVLAQYDGWKGVEIIGDPILGAREFLLKLREKYFIVIHTTRTNSLVNKGMGERELRLIVEDWLVKNDMIFDAITVKDGKPIAVAYVDDRAVMCCPQKSDKAFENALLAVDYLTR